MEFGFLRRAFVINIQVFQNLSSNLRAKPSLIHPLHSNVLPKNERNNSTFGVFVKSNTLNNAIKFPCDT